jgi:hypothetical protein
VGAGGGRGGRGAGGKGLRRGRCLGRALAGHWAESADDVTPEEVERAKVGEKGVKVNIETESKKSCAQFRRGERWEGRLPLWLGGKGEMNVRGGGVVVGRRRGGEGEG